MRKLLVFAIVVVCFGFAGCGSGEPETTKGSADIVKQNPPPDVPPDATERMKSKAAMGGQDPNNVGGRGRR